MAYTKEQHENLINNSPFLAMHKEPDGEEEYKAAFRKFTGDLYSYVSAYVYTGGKMSAFGLEFVKTAKACISGYDKAYGDFLHYFLASMATAIKRARAKQQIQNVRKGMVIGRGTDNLCRRIFRYADSKGIDPRDERMQKRIAEKFGIPIDSVQKALKANYAATPVSNISKNGDEEVDLFDTIIGTTRAMEESVIEDEKLVELVRTIDVCFSKCRKDTKRPIGFKLTALLIDAVDGDEERLKAIRGQASFYADEIFAVFESERKIPADKQMADMLGVSAESFSRSINRFMNKIREERK